MNEGCGVSKGLWTGQLVGLTNSFRQQLPLLPVGLMQ